MSIPFHKQTDPNKQAGQIVHKPDVTLNDYIARKTECCGNPLRGCKDCPPPKKMTFDEWYEINSNAQLRSGIAYRKACQEAWNAALKEGKL